MDCGQIQSLFTAYHDGELAQRNLLPFERHLADCPHCAREWQAFQSTLRLLQEIKPLPVPPDLFAGIHEKLAEKHPREKHVRKKPGPRLGWILQKLLTPVPLTAAASLTAAALALTLIVKPHTSSGPPVSPAAAPAPIARVSGQRPPVVTLPVSLGQPETYFFNLAPPFHGAGGASWYQNVMENEVAGRPEPNPYVHIIVPVENPPSSTRWQIDQPLIPDVIIRMHHLSPEGMRWLHDRVKEKGRWQTRLYSKNYFLVLVNPNDLSALYNLLQQQHLPFSSYPLSGTGRTAHKSLVVAVRP